MSIKAAIYLDSNAGAPLKPVAREKILSLLDGEANLGGPRSFSFIPNPSSIHSYGRRAKRLSAEAREKIAGSLGATVDPEQLVFTSSGTEANQLVVRSVLEPLLNSGKSPHWITTRIEHDSNRKLVDWVRSRGGRVSELPVDSEGRIQLNGAEEVFSQGAVLCSFVWVNNETGVIADVKGLVGLSQRFGVPVHIDAAQAWGKISVDLSILQAQYVTFSGHKIGGLAGTGVLWVGRGQLVSPVILGKQEKGRRGGSENLLGVVALGAAAGDVDPEGWTKRVRPIRDRLEFEITRRISGTWVNGGRADRVANTLNLNFDGVERDGLVMALDLSGYSVSAGSACSSGVLESSHVLQAMGKTELQAMAAIRVSLVDETSWVELEGFVTALDQAVARMRSAAVRSF